MVVPRRHPQIVVRDDTDLPHGCRESSARADADSAQVDADFLCGWAWIFRTDGHGSPVRIQVENGRNLKANFVRNNAEGSRNMSQGLLKLSL